MNARQSLIGIAFGLLASLGLLALMVGTMIAAFRAAMLIFGVTA